MKFVYFGGQGYGYEYHSSFPVVAVGRVGQRRPAHGHGGARALTDGEAVLVLHPVVRVPVGVRLLDLYIYIYTYIYIYICYIISYYVI